MLLILKEASVCYKGAVTTSAGPDQGPAEQISDNRVDNAAVDAPYDLKGLIQKEKTVETVPVTHTSVKNLGPDLS